MVNFLNGSSFFLIFPSSCNKIGDGPEGPEVKNLAKDLCEQLFSLTLTGITVPEGSKYEKHLDRISKMKFPYFFEWCFAVGKQLVFVFTKDLYFVSHLAMEGKWKWEERKFTRILLHFESNQTGKKKKLYYDDTLNWGNFEIYNRKEFEEKISKIGIDILSEDYPEETWLENLALPKYCSKPICELLLDQALIAGIGNYLRAEILYRAKIHPFRTPEEMTKKEKIRILQKSRETIRESYELQGCTIRSYENFDGSEGGFQCEVYCQKKTPDGKKIETLIDKSKRKIYWCPKVQV